MNKTDALMWVMRVHEAIRRLPEDAEVNGVDLTLYRIDGNRISIYLSGEHEIKNAVARNETYFSEGSGKRVTVSDSYGVDYWWCEYDYS